MKAFGLGGYALGCLGLTMLVHCVGMQAPAGVPPARVQASAGEIRKNHVRPSVLPQAGRHSLLYVASGNDVDVYQYPRGRLLGSLGVAGVYLCSDIGATCLFRPAILARRYSSMLTARRSPRQPSTIHTLPLTVPWPGQRAARCHRVRRGCNLRVPCQERLGLR